MTVHFFHESGEGTVPIKVRKVVIFLDIEEALITYLDGREDYTCLDQIDCITED